MKDLILRGAARVALARPFAAALARGVRTGEATGLDRQIAAILALQRLLRIPALDTMEPAAARRFAEQGLSPMDLRPAKLAGIDDATAPGPAGPIPIRVYTPADASPHWIVYFHGGGGVIGSIRSSEPVVRYLAAQTRCTIASVEYRLGPEHKHPAAIDDCLAAYAAIAARMPAGGKLAVAGDSFGAFLAAHVDHAAARKPDLQVLVYPIVDLTLSSPSIDRHADGYLLTRDIMRYFRGHYLHATDDQRAGSPAFFASHAGAAPAIIATAGYDPLVDEGDAYAAALRAAGVSVRHRRYPALIHGFLSFAGAVKAARVAVDELAGDIRDRLGIAP